MKLIKEYAWDDVTTLEHEDFFPEINEWAYNNNLVVGGWLVFPVGTKFTEVTSDNYYKFYNVTLPNGNSFTEFPISYMLMDEFEACI